MKLCNATASFNSSRANWIACPASFAAAASAQARPPARHAESRPKPRAFRPQTEERGTPPSRAEAPRPPSVSGRQNAKASPHPARRNIAAEAANPATQLAVWKSLLDLECCPADCEALTGGAELREAPMIWMGLLMGLPLLGFALFFVYPWRMALVPYLLLVGISLFFDSLMMRAMRIPVRTGPEEMIGSKAVVLNWNGHSGQVNWNDEIWQAKTEERRSFTRGDSLVIESISGLILLVKSAVSEPNGSDGPSGNGLCT
jgi:membrane protein implicated in regulation of membrane protease activity